AGPEPLPGSIPILRPGRPPHDGQIDRAAPGVPRLGGDVAIGEKAGLGDAGIELAPHQIVIQVFGPRDEMIDGALRPVAVVDLQTEAATGQAPLHSGDGKRGPAGEDAERLAVATDRPADEVVATV